MKLSLWFDLWIVGLSDAIVDSLALDDSCQGLENANVLLDNMAGAVKIMRGKGIFVRFLPCTTQSVISQLESAEYEGHSFSMLQRIAEALHRRVEIRLVPTSPAMA